MKIEEVIKLYSFLGNLNNWGFAGVCIVLLAGMLIVVIPLKEKVKIPWAAIFAIIIISGIGLKILHNEAIHRLKLLQIGNLIKEDLVYSNFKQKVFAKLSFPDGFDSTREVVSLIELQDEFPGEFSIVDMDLSSKNYLYRKGITILDPHAKEKIEKNIEAKAKKTAVLIRDFMNKDSLSIFYTDAGHAHYSLQNDIDNDGWLIGQDFFKALVGYNGLRPVYNSSYAIVAFR